MPDYGDLEFTIARQIEDIYTLQANFTPPGSGAEIRLGIRQAIRVKIDREALNQALPDMQAYGKSLTAAVFGPSEVKEFLARALVVDANPVRFRLILSNADELMEVHWETLQDPQDGTLLSANANIIFSRYFASGTWKIAKPRPKQQVKALVAVATPSDLANHHLAPIDAPAEIERAQKYLGTIQVDVIEGRCSSTVIIDRLRAGYDIFYLVAHGTLAESGPFLWLEGEDGKTVRLSARDFSEQINNLDQPPLLAVLASCDSAGSGTAGDDKESRAFQALGPLLSAAGVPAVVAMQGKLSMHSAALLMPVFFSELEKDGEVDRALAVARNVLLADRAQDTWVPVLFLRLKNGKIWQEQEAKKEVAEVKKISLGILKTQRIWFVVIFLAILGIGGGLTALYFGLREKKPAFMTGDFRIAVASFYVNGDSGQKDLGYDLADSVRMRLEQDLEEIDHELVITVWGPKEVGAIQGASAEARAASAENIAKQIHADMVIYGIVDVSEKTWHVLPEFFISAENFYEAREIVGQHDLGNPIEVKGIFNAASRKDLGTEMFARGKTLSLMSVGLGYIALHQYPDALDSFKKGLDIPNLGDEDGKKVLYFFTGEAAGNVGVQDMNAGNLDASFANFALAEQMLNAALALDSEYARPYIGLAKFNFYNALLAIKRSQSYQDAEAAVFLENCFKYLDLAARAPGKPPLAEIDTKIHFERGQCYWLKSATGQLSDYQLALGEYQQVLAAYGEGAKPQLKELAGEAHGRIALIYKTEKKIEAAIQEYKTAAELLKDYPDRSSVYEDRANQLLGLTPTPVNP